MVQSAHMIRRAASYFWSVRDQFSRYFLVGLTTFVLDMGSLILFTDYVGFRPVTSVIINQLIVISFNFSLHKYWSFQSKAWQHKEFVRYMALIAWNYIVSVVCMYILHTQAGYDYRIVRLATIALIVTWTFFVYKYWVYHGAR